MGFNANYRLLIEGNSSAYHIPEYKSYYHPSIFTEEYMMQTMSDFNQEIRETQNFLESLIEIADCSPIDEGATIVNITDKISNAIARVKTIIGDISQKIMTFINKVIDAIESKVAKAKDKIEQKYRTHERINLLKKALDSASDENKVIAISNLNPTTDLLDKNFPDISVIGGDMTKMATDTMNNYCINIVQKSGRGDLLNDTEVKASDSFVSFIEGEKDAMLRKVFGKYDYDPTAITKSAIDAAEKAFGSSEKEDKTLSVDLYMLACDNLADADSIVSDMKKMRDTAKKNFDIAKRDMDTISHSSYDLMKKANKYVDAGARDLNQNYHDTVRTIVHRINRALDVIRQIVNADYIFVIRKVSRINDIYNVHGDSMKVKRTCHALINKFIGTESTNEAYNGFDDVMNEMSYLDEFASFTVLANEALLEESYTEAVVMAINEAEGDPSKPDGNPSSPDNKPQATEPATTEADKKPNIIQKAGASIKEWITSMMEKFGQMIERFKNRYNEIIIKREGKLFWEKNKEAITNMNFTDTKVNQWFKFNIPSFKNSTFIELDESSLNNPDFKSDEAFQEAILKKIYGSGSVPAAGDNESFTDRVKKAYQGEYIDDKEGEGKLTSEVDYKHDEAVKFIDDMCTKGFDSESLGSVIKDYKAIKANADNVSKNYETYASKMPSASESSTAKPADATNTEPKNEAAFDDEFEHFNLAEHFGLIHEATFTVGKADATAANAASGNDGENTNNSKNKELDAMIKRCVNYNTIAVTAKMTAAVAAYKQIMGLFKAVLKSKAPAEEKTEEPAAEEKKEEK